VKTGGKRVDGRSDPAAAVNEILNALTGKGVVKA
jgi:hypothetical protein